MRIIFIEDEPELSNIVKKGLEENGYSVDVAYNGEDGLHMAKNYQSDLIVLDIMLPGMDGLELLKTLREEDIQTPVILLTARDSLPDKIKGLDLGADDYLTKPFEFEELLARIRALLRRRSETKEALIKIDDLEINTANHEVKREGKLILLTAREYALLEYLAYNRDKVIGRLEITEHIYNESFDMDSNIVDVYINYLRNKIDKGYPKKLIHTVRGTGYILKG